MDALLLNAGSSSLKLSLLAVDSGKEHARALAEWPNGRISYEFSSGENFPRSRLKRELPGSGHEIAARQMLLDLREFEPELFSSGQHLFAVGHRVVHGGDYSTAIQITPAVRESLLTLCDLAPLHNPPSLCALAAAESELPLAAHYAIFDTSYHRTMLPEACRYAVPAVWERDWGIKRYGFHGLSHSYCAGRAAELLEVPVGNLKMIICHLGNGCSATAVKEGKSVDTTMGFTPLDGLVMGTRSGSLDAGAILHVQQHHGLSPEEVSRILHRESGLLGISGLSSDMRQILAAADEGHQRAKEALAVYVYRVRQAIGALTTSLGGLDALVFTAGVGENSAVVRSEICRGLEFLGLDLDGGVNRDCRSDQDIASPGSAVRVLVIKTREDISMLRALKRAWRS